MRKQYESAIVQRILKFLNGLPGVYAYKRNEGYYRRGMPDITGSVLGYRLEIECKRPGGRLTQIQEHNIQLWTSIGAIAGVAHNVQEVAKIILDFFDGERGSHPLWERLRAHIAPHAGPADALRAPVGPDRRSHPAQPARAEAPG